MFKLITTTGISSVEQPELQYYINGMGGERGVQLAGEVQHDWQ